MNVYTGIKQAPALTWQDTAVWAKAWDTPLLLLSVDLSGAWCSSCPAHTTRFPWEPVYTGDDLGHVLTNAAMWSKYRPGPRSSALLLSRVIQMQPQSSNPNPCWNQPRTMPDFWRTQNICISVYLTFKILWLISFSAWGSNAASYLKHKCNFKTTNSHN